MVLVKNAFAIANFHLPSLDWSPAPQEGLTSHKTFSYKEVCKRLPEHLYQWMRELIHNHQLLQQITFQADGTFSTATDYAAPSFLIYSPRGRRN